MSKAPDIYTDRLCLREITESDSNTIVRLRSNPDVYRYFVAPHRITKEEHLYWFKNSYLQDSSRIDWMGFISNNERVGIFGIKKLPNDSNKAEISYIVDPLYYGCGYASEAVNRLIEFCRDVWNTKTVIAEIHKDNIKSIRFVKKMGFVKLCLNGDFIIYSFSLYD